MLYDFDFSYSPGIVSDSQGNLYGANLVGGISAGSIFELSPPGNGSLWWTQKTIYTFVLTTGTGPSTGLIFDTEGNLYGATGLQGGTAAQGNCGFVFKLNPPNGGIGEWSESVLHTFAGGNEACGTSNLVMDVQGNLYGASEGGGAKNSGAVYELSPPSSGTGAWNETVIYTFTGGTGGLYPLAPLAIDPSGNLYGTTTYGGSVPGCGSAGCGMVFELSPPSGGGAWTEKTLYTFTGGNDGGNPYSLTLDSQGNLYGGTTTAGNISACISFITLPGCGGIFELSPPPGGSGPWAFSVLHNFSGGDGQGYTSGLVFDSSGALFGATADGGTGTCTADGCGLVFSLTPPSNGTGPWTETVLYDFSGQNDGSTPFPFSPVLLDSRRNIYGTLSLSETTNCSECGAVYELSPTQLVPSHTALIPSMNSANLGDSVTFTATVTPTGPPVPTGTVGFAVNGATMAGCSSVVLSAGQAACSTSALAPGGNSVVAVYSGDTRYSGSAGAQPENVNEPELGLSATPPSVSVKAGGQRYAQCDRHPGNAFRSHHFHLCWPASRRCLLVFPFSGDLVSCLGHGDCEHCGKRRTFPTEAAEVQLCLCSVPDGIAAAIGGKSVWQAKGKLASWGIAVSRLAPFRLQRFGFWGCQQYRREHGLQHRSHSIGERSEQRVRDDCSNGSQLGSGRPEGVRTTLENSRATE